MFGLKKYFDKDKKILMGYVTFRVGNLLHLD